MQKTSRTRLTAVLASAVVLFSVLTASPGAHASPVATKNTSPYTRAQAEKLLEQVQQALAPRRATARTAATPLPRRDLGLLLHQLQVARSALSAKDQSIVDGFGRPVPAENGCTDFTPVLEATWKAKSSGHFCVHYRETGSGAATLSQVNTTLAVLNSVFTKEVSSMGFRKPLNDGDGLYDVFLDDIGAQQYYGFCTTDDGASTSTAWCGLDNDFDPDQFGGALAGNSLRVTAAHEFFHAIQFAYDTNEAYWFMEGTAVWMEDQVYPSINDYVQYLNYSQITQSQVPIDTAGSFERYGAVIFWKYLSEGYHNVDLIRQVWISASVSKGSRTGIYATIAVLKSKNINFAAAFARFSLWNTLPPGSYADRSLWPEPVPWGKAKLTTTSRDTGTQSVTLDHLSSANVTLIPSGGLPTKSRLTISVDAPSSSVVRVRLQVRKRDGSTIYPTFTLNSAGNGSHSIYFSGQTTSSVRVTLANVTVGGNDKKVTFRARVTLP